MRSWARIGQIIPRRGRGGRFEFTFQELLLLKTTRGLVEAGVPARRVRRVWSSLRRQLAAGLPLTSITIFADGSRAVAWDGNARWRPDSGQFLLNFDAREVAERVELQSAAAGRRSLTAEQWFHIACELESTSPLEARRAYHQALALDRDFTEAHVNLGRQYHEAGDLQQAEAHYREAVRCSPGDAICHFNLGVVLEDRDRHDEAIRAYEHAIELDPDSADAHYNLGLLLDARKQRADAIRHLMTARRLYGDGGPARRP